MRVNDYVLEYDGGVLVSEISIRRDISTFANPLRGFNGDDQWALSLAPLPPGQCYADVLEAGDYSTDYIQAAGSGPDAITVEIRKPRGRQWGTDWVRYVIGHPHNDDAPLDVAITLPASTQMVSRHEVFNADEAAQLFDIYYKSADIPPQHAPRPIEGYTTDGTIIDLRDGVPRRLE
ncbi:MAG TPA: hypothetical protein VLZ05_28940 [Mycobacterium sp.]|nr:hypothetical protein [Mycobacterium sp.]HUH72513.1 hypothetical protein [Mycobacterium sp.]